MKSTILLTTIGAACFSLLLGGCGYGDKEEASASSASETSMLDDVKDSAGSMVDDVKESAGSVVESAEGMADDAVSAVKDTVGDAVESGQAAMDDAVKGVQDKLSGSDADVDTDEMKKDLGAEMKKLL